MPELFLRVLDGAPVSTPPERGEVSREAAGRAIGVLSRFMFESTAGDQDDSDRTLIAALRRRVGAP